jgi:iron complex outermembrane receptor protein
LHHCGHWYTDNANQIRVGDHTTLEAAVTSRLKFGELTLRGRNLTDELYADYTDISPDQLTLAAPRSVELSLYARF